MSPDDAIDRLPGAGKVTAARLGARGITAVRDLAYFFPRTYEDFRRVYALGELGSLAAGTPVVVRGTVVRVHKFFRRMLDVIIEQDGAALRARWFRPNAGMSKSYAKGTRAVLAGNLRRSDTGEHQLVHPSNVTARVAEDGSLGIRARYPAAEGVPGRTVEKLVAAAVDAVADRIDDVLPVDLRTRLDFPALGQALRDIHGPAVSLTAAELAALAGGTSAAQRRFAFEDLFVLQVGLARERSLVREQRAWISSVTDREILSMLKDVLPFPCTAAQERAISAVASGLRGPAPLQCLLQGEVGSGKTVAVFAACLQVARSGGQSLVMAPTAVLAEQHGRTLAAWGQGCGLRTALLHAGLPAAEQRRVLDAAAEGEVDLVVGTHALLEDRLRLRRLALAVVDEQHRFGVRQRARLRRVGSDENGWQIGAQDGMVPHLLVLSATPIPRTLALTMYGDLDLVTLDGLPPGRKPVETHVSVGAEARERTYRAVRESVGQGAQVFVVCPAIGEVDQDDSRAISVIALAKRLRPKLAPARIGILHGQMPAADQQRIVASFRARLLDVLVATTVLEVGIDVPSATVMVIEDSDRFGLSQLHQLRGRVGRGGDQGSCYLLTRSEDPKSVERLRVLATTHDGFRIAEVDLRQRGAGDLQGTRQTGTPDLRFADLSLYADLLELARGEALALLAKDPALADPEHAELQRRASLRWQQARPFAEEAG